MATSEPGLRRGAAGEHASAWPRKRRGCHRLDSPAAHLNRVRGGSGAASRGSNAPGAAGTGTTAPPGPPRPPATHAARRPDALRRARGGARTHLGQRSPRRPAGRPPPPRSRRRRAMRAPPAAWRKGPGLAPQDRYARTAGDEPQATATAAVGPEPVDTPLGAEQQLLHGVVDESDEGGSRGLDPEGRRLAGTSSEGWGPRRLPVPPRRLDGETPRDRLAILRTGSRPEAWCDR